MNAIQEDRLIHWFKELYAEFPVGVLKRETPPLPYYVMETSNGLIGIELTELFHTGDVKERSSFKNQLTEKTIALLEGNFLFCFSLDVFPDHDVRIGKHEIDQLALLSPILARAFNCSRKPAFI